MEINRVFSDLEEALNKCRDNIQPYINKPLQGENELIEAYADYKEYKDKGEKKLEELQTAVDEKKKQIEKYAEQGAEAMRDMDLITALLKNNKIDKLETEIKVIKTMMEGSYAGCKKDELLKKAEDLDKICDTYRQAYNISRMEYINILRNFTTILGKVQNDIMYADTGHIDYRTIQNELINDKGWCK